jgi:hypothetical protein
VEHCRAGTARASSLSHTHPMCNTQSTFENIQMQHLQHKKKMKHLKHVTGTFAKTLEKHCKAKQHQIKHL